MSLYIQFTKISINERTLKTISKECKIRVEVIELHLILGRAFMKAASNQRS